MDVAGKTAGFYGDVIVGGLKGVGSTISNIASLPQQVGRFAAEKITGKKAPEQFKMVSEMAGNSKIFKPENEVQKGAFAGEQFGEMFVPAGVTGKISSKIPTVSRGAPLISRIAGGAMKTGARALESGIEYGGKTLLQTGDTKKAAEAGLISATVPMVGDVLKAFGSSTYKAVLPLSAKEAKLVQSYKAGAGKIPTTMKQTAFDKGMWGTETGLGIQAKKESTALWTKKIAPQLKTSTKKVNMDDFFEEAERRVIRENPELSTQKSLLEALNAFKDDYKVLIKKGGMHQAPVYGDYKIKEATMEQLQKFKEGWAKNIPEKVYMGKPIAGAANNVKNTLADIAREKIYNALGKDARKAYFDYGNLIALQELGQRAMTGGKLKGGFGGFWNGIKDMALTPIGTFGGRKLYQAGQGIEIIGKQGARTIADLLD
jgi:hypothetical protein